MIPFAFFGSSEFSIYVLEELKKNGLLPSLIITTPDKPKGRGLALASTPVKIWAKENGIAFLDPAKLDDVFLEQLKNFPTASLGVDHWPLFIVASYGKIIPEKIIDLPRRKTLNVHPSLLPKYRGASPIQNAMIDDAKETGVTIIKLDKEMDHGPIIAREKILFNEWPTYGKVEEKLGTAGGNLLAKILPDWIKGEIREVDQEQTAATFTKKITKENGLIDLKDISPDAPLELAYLAFRKIQAYHHWPGAYFFIDRNGKNFRIKITLASWKNDKLIIEKVIPEGKKEMAYRDFLK